jgi:hypothetical protein
MEKVKVVFNNDPQNFEEFDKLEDAKKFADRYANAKVEYTEKHIESILKKEENSEMQKKFVL